MRRVGLFVGINNYKNGISPLRYARNDAMSLMTTFLQAQYDKAELLLDEDARCDTILGLKTSAC